MPGDPTPPESPDPGTQQVEETEQVKTADPPKAPRQRRLWRAKFLVPVVVCLAFGAGSWLIYDASSPGEMPSPSYATLVLNSAAVPVDVIGYQVSQQADQANIQVWVEVSSTVRVPGATLEVIPQCRLEVRDRSLAFFGWFLVPGPLSRSRIVIMAR